MLSDLVTAPAINQTFRLLEAPPLKEALKGSRGVLALITSAWFYDEVVRHSEGLDPATFRPVRVAVKETRTTGWISLPDRPFPADAGLLSGARPRVATPGTDDYRTWRRFRRHAKVLSGQDDTTWPAAAP